MERLGLRARGGALGRPNSAAASETSTAPPAKGKFKLRATKDPLPLLTKKDSKSSRETKPKPTFLKSAGGAAPTDKTSNSKTSVFVANSFARPPPAKDSLKMRTGGFSFMKFQPKNGETKKVAGNSSGKAAPPAFAPSKPFLGKFSVAGLNKKSAKSASEGGLKAGKEPLFKPQVKASMPFAFRADTKSSVAKKRKTAETVAHEDRKNAFPCKSVRTEGIGGFALNKSARSSKEVNTGKQPPRCNVASEKAQRGGIRSSFSFAAKPDAVANEGAMLKKRGLVLHAAESGPMPKRSKRAPTQDAPVHRHGEDVNSMAEERIESGSSPTDITSANGDLAAVFELERETSQCALDATESVHPAVLPPDCREDCWSNSLSGIEEELALKLVCTLDDDKEDEFLLRAAAIQDFTDRVGLEQKQFRNRLLDAHADVSESLLDALTDLMAEEGGIGIDKLVFDVNLDADIDDAFLQDPELQVLQ
ncbi:hypothetical protein PF008_g1059 [Phytophthora fragariae]|uniref:Uncharacterized protein n=1 Tax=Phytophthora fragariae TaxID=53985 RepID=A0A6G0SN22_9STRA|nr:hypothetical protein PF008_g1059 [Phytophthora fragariae]